MTTLGWIFMTASLTMVWGGAFWCYRKVLTAPTPPNASSGEGH